MDEINFNEGFKETLMEILAYCSRNSVTAVTLELGDIEMDIEFRAVAERDEE